MYEKGITENEIIAIKPLIELLLYNSPILRGNNIANTNIKNENVWNLSINNNKGIEESNMKK